MADIVDVASIVNCATGMQLRIAFKAIVKANPAIKIDTKNVGNDGAPYRQRATGTQLYDAFVECNRVLGADTVKMSTIQNRMDGSQLKDAFMAINAALAGTVVAPAAKPAPVVAPPAAPVPIPVTGSFASHLPEHSWLPAGSSPVDKAAAPSMGGDPAWGHLEYAFLADGSTKIHWDGAAWQDGTAP